MSELLTTSLPYLTTNNENGTCTQHTHSL